MEKPTVHEETSYGLLDTISPPKDSLDAWCTLDAELLERIVKHDTIHCDLYYLNGELFTGWACLTLEGPHKFRYGQYVNGKMIRRIAYYDNGQIDGDFRLKDCKNYGPSRMWLYNGKPYIDEYYNPEGVKQGIQKQWHDNGNLAREAKYVNDSLIYEKRYNRQGVLVFEP